MNVDEKDADRGLYRKYEVNRTDGRDGPGEKHHGCAYFVLDLDHDPHALPALVAYAKSCHTEYPELRRDLIDEIHQRLSVGVYRVNLAEDRPPVWAIAADEVEAEKYVGRVIGTSGVETKNSWPVAPENYDHFYQTGDIYPMLMRLALSHVERQRKDDWQGMIIADGAVRAGDGEPRTAGALGE